MRLRNSISPVCVVWNAIEILCFKKGAWYTGPINESKYYFEAPIASGGVYFGSRY